MRQALLPGLLVCACGGPAPRPAAVTDAAPPPRLALPLPRTPLSLPVSVAPGWPETITYARLTLSREALAHEHLGGGPAARLAVAQAPEVLRQSYPVLGPRGHGLLSTEVIYEVAADRFYLRSDCLQGHYDGVLGPFPGDPRLVLAP